MSGEDEGGGLYFGNTEGCAAFNTRRVGKKERKK